MKTNIIKINTIMKNVVNRAIGAKKNYLKYICAVLLLIGTSARTWATVTDTFGDFTNCGWGFNTNSDPFASGTYTLDKLILIGDKVKVNTYSGYESLLLTKANGGGSVTLPAFDGTVSKIKLYTHSNCDGTYNTEVGVYVNGTKVTTIILNRSTLSAQYTFSPVVAKGASIMLHNESVNAVAQLTQIEVTHEGAAISSGANSIIKSNEPADGGTFTCKVGGSEVSSAADGATVVLTATPNTGYTLVGFEVTANGGYCSYGTYVPNTWDVTVSGSYQFTMPDANVVVEAVWDVATTYTITYNNSKALCAQNGSGSWPSNVTGIAPNAVYSTLPSDIELSGVDDYTFAGWTTNGSYSSSTTAPSPLYTTSITVDANKILYPVFSHGGTTGSAVSFSRHKNTAMTAGYFLMAIGQSGSQPCVGPNLNTTTYKLDPITASVTDASASVADRQAMWQVEASGTYWTIKNVYTNQYIALRRSGGDIVNNKIDMVSSVTNDAKWTVIQKNEHYFIQSAADANYYLTYKSSTWYAHNFEGKTDNDINNYSGSIYLYKASTTPGATTTTYTITPPCITYTLTYNANGATSGTVPATATTYASGAVVIVKGNSGDLAKPGYDFNGWKTGASSGTAYAAGSSITMNASYTLYAQWVAHDITLELDANTANGGSTDGSGAVKYDATAVTSITHATGQTGKTLLGYYTAPTAGTKVLKDDGTFAAATVSGYIASSKWRLDESPVTLHAQWRNNQYYVAFDMNATGPTGTMTNQTFTYGTAQNLKNKGFTWSEHNFEGWATSPSGEVVYGNQASVLNLTDVDGATVTLYAVWTDKTYNDYKFTCVDISLTTEDGKAILVTSRNGVNIMATKKLILTVDGTTGPIDLSSDGNVLKFYKKVEGTGGDAGKYKYVELTGANRLNAPVEDVEVYVSYNPPASPAGTGAITEPRITVTQGANVRNYDGKIHARNLPDAVAIVAKIGNVWEALPANITTAGNPTPVLVNTVVEDGVLKAQGPSTLAYKLWPVKTVVGTGDRFGTATSSGFPKELFGDRLRFAGNSDKALWTNNNTSASTIKNDLTVNSISSGAASDAADKAYEWIVTTTETGGQFVYTLTTAHGTNTNDLRVDANKWGTYASGVNQLYILPLVEVTPLDLTVMEWGVNEIAVKTTNSWSPSAITANIGTGGNTTVTKTALGGDIYKLTGVGDLKGNPSQQLLITVTDGGSKQMVVQIPFIVAPVSPATSETKTEQQLAQMLIDAGYVTTLPNARKLTKDIDVVVRNGGTLSSSSSGSGTFRDVYIYPGGKADISTNSIGIQNVYLRGGFSWLDAVKDYRLPQMLVGTGKKITGIGTSGNGIYYDLYLDNAMYYVMTLPKDVLLADVTTETGSTTFDAWVKGYSGEGRTKKPKENGWSYAWSNGGTTLYRGIGYEIAIKPIGSRTIGILRFPLLKSTAWSNEATPAIPVTAWGLTGGELNDGVNANDAGWNFVGNPFFTTFRNTDSNGQLGSSMEVRSLDSVMVDDKWTGKYGWTTSDVKYLTVPNKLNPDYEDVRVKNYDLEAFYPFFIQAKTTGTLTFSNGTKILKAPSIQRASVPEREVNIDFELSDANGNTDVSGLNISNDYAEIFDMDDKEKTISGLNYMKVYTMVGEHRTAFNSLPESSASQPIPVGYIAPKAGEYTFSLPLDGDYTEVDQVLLTDYETGAIVNLLLENYSFETAAGEFNERLALNVILKSHNTTTDADNVHGNGLDFMSVFGGNKEIVVRGLPIGSNVWIYDAAGKLVNMWTDVRSAGVQTIVPASGVYSVRAIYNSEAVTKRAIVR